MQPEIGELFVGAYLRIAKTCPIVQYNVFAEKTQGEVDVLGLDYAKKRLFVCEVATHLDGLHYPGRKGDKHVDASIDKLRQKLDHAKAFVSEVFPQFANPTFMIWSPYVPDGEKTKRLAAMAATWAGPGKLDVRVNKGFADAVQGLADLASRETKQRGEVFYRALQLLTHLRGARNKRLKLRLE